VGESARARRERERERAREHNLLSYDSARVLSLNARRTVRGWGEERCEAWGCACALKPHYGRDENIVGGLYMQYTGKERDRNRET